MTQPKLALCRKHPELGKQLIKWLLISDDPKNSELDVDCVGCKIDAGETREKKSDDQSWR